MTYIIIEDEPIGRLFIQEIMATYFSEWKLLGVCANVSEGIQAIRQLKPKLVLLDIEIGEGTGFEILDVFPEPEFKVIFISGYENYLLKAIKYAALDYILKPLNIEELGQALNKLSKAGTTPDIRLKWLKESKAGRQTKQDQIVVPNGLGYTVVQLDDINYIEADGRYVYFYLSNGNKIMASHSIGHYEKLFEDSQFVRIHKSHIANMNKVTRLLTKPALCLELKDGTVLDIASRRKEFVLTRLNVRNET